MPILQNIRKQIFELQSPEGFEKLAMQIFRYQCEHNDVYRKFVLQLHRKVDEIKRPDQIPFLPIEFFKTQKVVCGSFDEEAIFTSSGTSQQLTSNHFVKDLKVYENSFHTTFKKMVGEPEKLTILALLPSYLERKGSSLIYMTDHLIKRSRFKESGFYRNEYEQLHKLLIKLKRENKKVLLLGVSYALLDMAEKYPIDFPGLMVMETGGMKGRRKELVREELHGILKKGFGVPSIYSEYGMTELLSQAYSAGEGIYKTPPWMKVLIRDTNDPLSLVKPGKTGGINVIDLANLHSCSFIATQDLGNLHQNGTFEVLGRFDNSDVRGCNLMVV